MPSALVVRGLELLLVLAAIGGAVDVWWQTGAFERRLSAEAKRRRRLLSLSQMSPPSIETLRQAWLEEQRQSLDRMIAGRQRGAPPPGHYPSEVRAVERPGGFRWTEPLRTAQLVARPFQDSDQPFLLDLLSRPDVVRWLYEPEKTAADIARSMPARRRRIELGKPGDGLQLVLCTSSDGRPVGYVSLQWLAGPHRQGEVGFIVHPDSQGRGYATEGAALMLAIGFGAVGLHRIVGRLEARNAASARVLEHLGMRREAHLKENEWVKGEWQDEVVYALLDREWASRTPLRPNSPTELGPG